MMAALLLKAAVCLVEVVTRKAHVRAQRLWRQTLRLVLIDSRSESWPELGSCRGKCSLTASAQFGFSPLPAPKDP